MSILSSLPRPLRRASLREARRVAEIDAAGRRLLLGFLLPLWIGSGFADWVCHRRSDIEHTAGTKEALIHVAQLTQAGVPILLGLFLEVNAGVLAASLGAFGLHQATAIWDVAYADARREVTPTEQHVHGLLEQVPAMAAAQLVALHSDQARALVGRGRERPRFRPERKRNPVSPATTAAIAGAIAAFGAVPYANEVIRCLRVAAVREPQP